MSFLRDVWGRLVWPGKSVVTQAFWTMTTTTTTSGRPTLAGRSSRGGRGKPEDATGPSASCIVWRNEYSCTVWRSTAQRLLVQKRYDSPLQCTTLLRLSKQ